MQMAEIENYSRLQKLLHWAVALLILWQFSSHFLIDAQPEGSALQNMLKASHGSSGITILLLMLIRLGVRLKRGVPALPTDMSSGLRSAARLTHCALYALVIAQTVTGIMAGAAGLKAAGAVHAAISAILSASVALHAGAAIWHLSKGEEVGRRMFRR